MSRRLAVEAALGALETFAESFDNLFERRNQRGLRQLMTACSKPVSPSSNPSANFQSNLALTAVTASGRDVR